MKIPTTSHPDCFKRSADTALSTPPEIPQATLTFDHCLDVDTVAQDLLILVRYPIVWLDSIEDGAHPYRLKINCLLTVLPIDGAIFTCSYNRRHNLVPESSIQRMIIKSD